MATLNKFDCFVESLAEKVHNLGSDTLTVALTNSAPIASNATLASITEISYTNLSSRVVTVSSSAQTSGTYKLTLADLVLTASGAVATFQYIVLYNATATGNVLIGWANYGAAVTLANLETFTIDFDQAAGAITLV